MINYIVIGTDGRNEAFEIGGHASGDNPLDPEVFEEVGRAVFQWLTQGKATFGYPGKGGCKGPYNVTSVTLARSGS